MDVDDEAPEAGCIILLLLIAFVPGGVTRTQSLDWLYLLLTITRLPLPACHSEISNLDILSCFVAAGSELRARIILKFQTDQIWIKSAQIFRLGGGITRRKQNNRSRVSSNRPPAD